MSGERRQSTEARLAVVKMFLADATEAFEASGIDYVDLFGEPLTERIAVLEAEVAQLEAEIAAAAAVPAPASPARPMSGNAIRRALAKALAGADATFVSNARLLDGRYMKREGGR